MTSTEDKSAGCTQSKYLGSQTVVGMLIAVIEATKRGESQLTAMHVCGQLAAYLCKSPKKNTQTGVYLNYILSACTTKALST